MKNVTSGKRLCSVCKEPLFIEEFSENVNSGLALLPPPQEEECILCYSKRVDIDKKLDPKEHEKFIKKETEIRMKKRKEVFGY
jgi:hypothetical protein|tara:strand:- start:51 stop:299 length:249 start_codon:yes stop_codon:yes gene_type:complete